MKKSLLLSLILTGIFSVSARAQGLNLEYWKDLPNTLWEDVKADTGFKVDSTIGAVFFDSGDGAKFATDLTPFWHAGSYLFLGAGFGARIDSSASGSGSKGLALLGPGLRLTGITRPLIHKALSQIPWLKKNAPLIDAAADAVSVTYAGGHDRNHPTKDKVLFNRHGITLGLELAFGGSKPDEGDVGMMSVGDEPSWGLR